MEQFLDLSQYINEFADLFIGYIKDAARASGINL
jgi:hypothetical protein